MENSEKFTELKLNLAAFSVAVNQWISELDTQIDALQERTAAKRAEISKLSNVKLFPVNGRRPKSPRPEQPAA